MDKKSVLTTVWSDILYNCFMDKCFQKLFTYLNTNSCGKLLFCVDWGWNTNILIKIVEVFASIKSELIE